MEVVKNNNNNAENIENDFSDAVLKLLVNAISKVGLFGLRLSAYIIDLILITLSDLIENKILDNWSWWHDKYYESESDDTQYKIEILETTDSTKHEYIMHRSNQYKKAFEKLESLVKVTDNTSIVFDKKLYDDLMIKLNKLIYIVDRESLQNGYKFAQTTQGQLEQDEIYKAFLTYNIMKGE